MLKFPTAQYFILNKYYLNSQDQTSIYVHIIHLNQNITNPYILGVH